MTMWITFRPTEIKSEGDQFFDRKGHRLILREYPITERLEGIVVDDLDKLREDFADWLSEKLQGVCGVEEVADRLFNILNHFPPLHDWLKLPADTRLGLNRGSIAQHLLLTSAFACAMACAWLEAGRSSGELIRFSDKGSVREPTPGELIAFVRVASMMHDLGKHPPEKHHERGREIVWRVLGNRLDRTIVEEVANIAYRHHSGHWYQERGVSPIGPLEELVAHADTLASASDRPDPKEKGLNPFGEVERFFKENFGDAKALCLISADTDRVKSYVFESARLPEVRGASSILTDLNQECLPQLLRREFRLPPECLIYAAGGSALIIAPTALADRIIEAIERLYLEKTLAATITAVSRPCLPLEWAKGIGGNAQFGDLVRWVGYDLRKKKEERAFWPFFELTPYTRRCDSCELRPATSPMPSFQVGEEGGWVCEVCYRKKQWGRREKSQFVQKFAEYAGEKSIMGAKTLEEIGRAAEKKARGYVGVIFADGNNLGARLLGCKTPAEFRTFSQEVLHATEGAVFAALSAFDLRKEIVCSDGKTREIYAFEIVSIGGDDVFLIVPSDLSLEVAIKICEEFQHSFDGKLTMSAGVLIMPDHFPIYHAQNIVEALLKSAKQGGRRAKKNGLNPSFIDFQVITGDTSLSEDLDSYRREVYRSIRPFDDYRLFERPYSINNLKKLIETARWAKEKFPSTHLYLLRRALSEHTPAFARNWYCYQLARHEQWQELKTRLFGPDNDEDAPWRWNRKEKIWTTPIVDLIEIIDYVRPHED